MKNANSRKGIFGFSLFEILISVAVLLLLAIISAFNIQPQLARTRDGRRKSDLYKIRNALEDYYDSANHFPQVLPYCGQPLTFGSNTILNNFYCDPKTNQNYYYETDSAGSWFRLYTKLELVTDPSIGLLGCSFGCGSDCRYNYGVSSMNQTLEKCGIYYACSPGGGKLGLCDAFDDPLKSECPKTYFNDPTCNSECSNPANRCKSSSGKHIPD